MVIFIEIFDTFFEVFKIDGFDQEIFCAQFQGGDGILDGVLAAHHNDVEVIETELGDIFEDGEAGSMG